MIQTEVDLTLEIQSSWENWLEVYFDTYCVYKFADHHKEFWEWVWHLEPYYPARSFVAIWSRGHGKSTSAELACVAVGAKQSRNYVLYVSETQDQADKHVQTIGSMLESELIGYYYPDLGSRQVNIYGNAKGWRRNRLITASGFIIDALGLDTASRGIKFEDKRPDLIVVDDVDGKHDSVAATKKKIEILTRSIIPAGARHVTVLAVQNLIHKNSIFSQLADGRADFLADRIVSGPHPALRNFNYAQKDTGIGHKIVAGEPTWAGASLEVCQDLIDKIGIESFLSECQHDVTQIAQGALFPDWKETHHIITWSEFASFFGADARDQNGKPRIPLKWSLGRGQDWGTTQGHPCVTVFATRPDSNSDLANCAFIYREIVTPNWTDKHQAPDPVWPGKVARMINEAQKAWNEESRMTISVMSHEQPGVLNTYLYELPLGERLSFTQWKPDSLGGIAELQEYLAIDKTKLHPFRKDPRTGQPLEGAPRMFFIVEDRQGDLYVDSNKKLAVRQWTDSKGLARLRWEIPQYHNRIDASGLEADKPEDKRDDDAIDALRGLAAYFFPRSVKPNKTEKIEQKLPEQLRVNTIKQMESNEDKGMAYLSRQIQTTKINKAEKPSNAFSWMQQRRRRVL